MDEVLLAITHGPCPSAGVYPRLGVPAANLKVGPDRREWEESFSTWQATVAKREQFLLLRTF